MSGCASDDSAGKLHIVDSLPAPGAAHPAGDPIRIRFDGYLDPLTDWSQTVTLSSAEVPFAARVTYDPVDRALVAVPLLDLRPGVGYTVTVLGERLRGVDGRPAPAEPFVLGFHAVADPPTRPRREEVDFADLAPVLADQCSCHGPEPLVYPPLTPAALVGRPSQRRPDRLLVVPGDALASYLVERVLPDYPTVRGLPMPPDEPLPDEVLRALITWIERL